MGQAHEMGRFERVPFFARVTVRPLSSEAPFEAHATSLSSGGVGLVCPMPLALGLHVALTFHLNDGERSVDLGELDGRVVQLRYDDDVSVLDVEFTSPLDQRSAPLLIRAIQSVS